MHLPPEEVFGTSTLPVDAFASNIFSDLSVTKTSPVEVFISISAASQD